MTWQEAIEEAKRKHPLDLVARLEFIAKKRDDARSAEERGAWSVAYTSTRDGYA